MKRGHSSKIIATRSGVREIRVEHRAIAAPAVAQDGPETSPPQVAYQETAFPGPLAYQIAAMIRGRVRFPGELWKDAAT